MINIEEVSVIDKEIYRDVHVKAPLSVKTEKDRKMVIYTKR
jgi:hypothetical protein